MSETLLAAPGTAAVAPPLRLAVVIGPLLRRWQLDALRALAGTGEAVPVALLATAAPPRPWPGHYAAVVGAACRGLDPVEIPGDWVALPPPADIDAVLVFEGEPPALPALLGRWRLRFGAAPPGELPGLRELARGSRSITLALQAGDHPLPLHAATIKTRRSHHLTLEALLEAAPALLLGACRRIRRGVAGDTRPLPALPAAEPARAMLGQARRQAVAAADRLLRRDVWSIGVVPLGVDALIAGAPLPPPRWLPPPRRGRFHADPFPLEAADGTHLLFEMWDEAAQRGWIACAPPDGDPAAAPAVLDLGCHMSYPAVFRWQGATWCAPEVSALGGLRLFRMGATPLDWTAVATLLEGVPLLDPTLFVHAGRWWLLAARADAAPDTDLHAWHAPCPLGPWVPHGLNPVVSDVRAARPAGAVLRHAGTLYRPGQDCAAGYGAAVVLHRILRLEPEAYSEVAVRRLEPGADWPWPDGLHTLNLIPGGLLIDAKRRVLTLRGR